MPTRHESVIEISDKRLTVSYQIHCHEEDDEKLSYWIEDIEAESLEPENQDLLNWYKNEKFLNQVWNAENCQKLDEYLLDEYFVNNSLIENI